MTIIKSFTSLKQAKILAKILPLESADMEYIRLKGTNAAIGSVPFFKDESEVENSAYDVVYERIPCWSLAALLNILPKYELNNFGDTIQLDVNLEALATEGDETLLDLVVNMIIRLNELKML